MAAQSVTATVPSDIKPPPSAPPPEARVGFTEDIERCFGLLSDAFGRQVDFVFKNKDGSFSYKVQDVEYLIGDNKAAQQIAQYVLSRGFTKPEKPVERSASSVFSEAVSVIGNLGAICRNSASLAALTVAVTILGIIAFPLTLIAALFVVRNGYNEQIKAVGGGSEAELDVGGLEQARFKILFGAMWIALAFGIGCAFIAGAIATTGVAAAVALGGLVFIGIVGLMGYILLGVSAVKNAYQINQFRNAFLKTLDLPRQTDFDKAERTLQMLQKGKGAKDWKAFERRVGEPLALKVREEGPALLIKLQQKDPIALEFAKGLIDEVDRATFRNKVTQICLTVIALIGIVSMVLLLLANPVATPLAIVAALLWLTVDSSHCNRAIGDLSFWMFRKGKVWKAEAFEDITRECKRKLKISSPTSVRSEASLLTP